MNKWESMLTRGGIRWERKIKATARISRLTELLFARRDAFEDSWMPSEIRAQIEAERG